MNLDAIRGEDEILRVLRAAQERIRLPENWCQGVCARDLMGNLVFSGSPEAVSFCSVGAFCSVAKFISVSKYMTKAAVSLGFLSVTHLNDQSSHNTAKAMFDRAQELRLADMLEAAVA